MLKFTLKVEYALKALVRLGLSEEPMSVPQISKAERIPPNFLEQILVRLRRKGFVRSIRGKKGGYMLALPPYEITVLDVIEAVEGKYGLVKCLIPGGEEECFVPATDCVLRSVWNRVQAKIKDILSDITIESIIQESNLRETLRRKVKVVQHG